MYFDSISKIQKGFNIKKLFILLFIISGLSASYLTQLEDFENEKQELINRYKIRIEIAKLDELSKRAFVLQKTLNCFNLSKSSAEIKLCKADESKRLLSMIQKYSTEISKSKFEKIKLWQKSYYKNKLQITKLKKRKVLLSKTLSCIKNSKNIIDLDICKQKDILNVEKIIQSYSDNPRVKDLKSKESLIDRYKIRIEISMIDKLFDRVEIFSKTLSCFKDIEKSVQECKDDEKHRILNLIYG